MGEAEKNRRVWNALSVMIEVEFIDI